MTDQVKRIGIMTSGGDAPGMNAAIRAVVRTAIYHDLHVFGISGGYEGMIKDHIKRMEKGDVGNIIQRGGTILKTARCQNFFTKEGRTAAFETLSLHKINALIVIGGNGSLTGALKFYEEFGIPTIGLPGTIDNDLFGTDYSIGFDTAVNTAMEAVDKIRDTADSHNRLFFVEVMGRNSGYIALHTGIGSGAGNIIIPEVDITIEELVLALKKGFKRDKLFSIVIVSEGSKLGNANQIAEKVQQLFQEFESKVTVLGHMQRGGAPSASDRFLSSRLGYAAVQGLLEGKFNTMVGIINNKIVYTPLHDAISKHKAAEIEYVEMAKILAL